ncbi:MULTISPECIES: hypothetical protein [unclassified Rhizobium]|uniref:hypothetical protein n=1 Tax=unclassified Rhizobium TaxID=2613769 RepID=UPI0012E3662F|nr:MULTISPECIES: hypothetical protein [unclassified Rhizobium]
MTLQACEKTHQIDLSWSHRLLHALTRALHGDCRTTGALDLDVTSDYIKRDLGLIDGREAPQDSKLTR